MLNEAFSFVCIQVLVPLTVIMNISLANVSPCSILSHPIPTCPIPSCPIPFYPILSYYPYDVSGYRDLSLQSIVLRVVDSVIRRQALPRSGGLRLPVFPDIVLQIHLLHQETGKSYPLTVFYDYLIDLIDGKRWSKDLQKNISQLLAPQAPLSCLPPPHARYVPPVSRNIPPVHAQSISPSQSYRDVIAKLGIVESQSLGSKAPL